MSSDARRDYVRNLAATLVARYGAKALEALVYVVAMRTVGGDAVGLVFLAQAASTMAYRLLDLGLYPVMARSAARRELDASTFEWIFARRALGTLLIASAFATYSAVTDTEHMLLLVGFFAANGLPVLHELPRAVLFGHERFDALARLNLSTKALESVVASAGMALGFGLPIWLLARLVSHGVFLFIARRIVLPVLEPRAAIARPTPAQAFVLVRRGLVFWFTRLLDLGSARVGIFLVTLHGGLEGAARLGLAGKLYFSMLGLLATATQVAYPRMARNRDRALAPGRLAALVGVALLLGVALHLVAPFAVRVLVGRWDPVMTEVLRALAPVLFFVAISRPLEVWLEAKDHERSVLAVAAASSVVSIAATFFLVRSMGVVGAGWSRVVGAAFETVLTLIVVGVITRRPTDSARPEGQDGSP